VNNSQSKRILIIGCVWPEPGSSAAGQRMMQLIDTFQQSEWEIVFASAAAKKPHSVNFSLKNVQSHSIEINNSEIDVFLNDLQPDAVLFDRFITEEQFGWRVAEQCPNALRVLDTEDLHCLRRARKKAVKENRDFTENELLKDETALREIASIFRSDLSLVISEYEFNLLKNLFKVNKSLLQYLPFMFEPVTKEFIQPWPKFEDRQHFVTIGNFRHAPNWDAVQYLKHPIWPLIRKKLPQAQVHIYGAYPSKKAKAMHQPEEGFFVEGWTEDASSVMGGAKVCLAPLRFGAGLKGKLTEAMRCGTPSITTSVGAEGINGDMKWSGLIADNPEDFVRNAVKLYTQKPLWQKAQQNGIAIINKRFNRVRHGSQLMNRISALQSCLKAHRQHNFIGAMLMHHTTAGAKYMARWIEAKNKAK
jgi:glycosyltransferase involved in cell wall biosynthesis